MCVLHAWIREIKVTLMKYRFREQTNWKIATIIT